MAKLAVAFLPLILKYYIFKDFSIFVKKIWHNCYGIFENLPIKKKT